MSDQADDLRRLVRRERLDEGATMAARPPTLAVLGGRRGLGATTVALNLAAALGERGQRVVLADADFEQASLTNLCQLPSACSVRELLSGRRDIHEVLVRGPAGVLLLPGARQEVEPLELSHTALRRVAAGLLGLSRHADWILLDLGSGAGKPAQKLLELAHGLLVVTAEDDTSVMDSYAAIKMLATVDRPGWVGLCVNQTTDDTSATGVYQRISESARNFLGRRVEAAHSVPADPLVPQAAAQAQAVVLASPSGPASAALLRLAVEVPSALSAIYEGENGASAADRASDASASAAAANSKSATLAQSLA